MVAIQLQQLEILPGRTVLLRDVTWVEFEMILAEVAATHSARLAYDSGWLEIIVPLPEHEYFKQSLSVDIEDIAEVLHPNYESYGSTTWRQQSQRQQSQQAGLASDNCFYFQNEALICGKLDINLAQDPPLDLALEIDITSKSLDRLPIYARLGVPEIWCYGAATLKVYQLQAGRYVESDRSLVFPMREIHQLPQLIEAYCNLGRLSFRQAVRNWVERQMEQESAQN